MQVKYNAKQLLIRLGLWAPLNLIRSIPGTYHWLRTGCSGAAPHPIKMMAVRSYLNSFSIGIFVETGTFLGDTLAHIAKTGVECASIELSPELHKTARNRFHRYKNVRLLLGDSGEIVPELLKEINQPVLFWLDGHYSAGVTASADIHTPVSAELSAILNHPIKNHVILIDDARCFDGTNGYPHLDELLRVVRDDGNYSAEVSIDIIRLTPKT